MRQGLYHRLLFVSLLYDRIEFLDSVSEVSATREVEVSGKTGERSDVLRACALMHATKVCADRHSPLQRA